MIAQYLDGAASAPAEARTRQVTAVWTADCSATVELARMSGPREGLLLVPIRLLDGHGSGLCTLDLDVPADRVELYERCLCDGTAFDIYRFVNLADLAWSLPLLRLPPALRAEWAAALAGR